MIVEADGFAADDRDLAHLAGDQRRVRRHAAERGQKADRRVHAANVLGGGLVATQNHDLAARGPRFGVLGEEYDLAGGGSRTGRQPLGQDALFIGGLDDRRRVEHRPQQLVQRLGLDAADGLVLGDQFLFHHLDGDPHAGESRPLAVAALQACTASRPRW